MMFMGMAPLGALLAGTLSQRFSAADTVAAGGVICVAGAAAFALRLPALRVQARQMIVAQGMMAGGLPEESAAFPPS